MCVCRLAESLTGSTQGEPAALAQLNKTWAELTDWLSLLDNMVQNQRVTVADLEDINDTLAKLQVSRAHPGAQGHRGYLQDFRSLLCYEVEPGTRLFLNLSPARFLTLTPPLLHHYSTITPPLLQHYSTITPPLLAPTMCMSTPTRKHSDHSCLKHVILMCSIIKEIHT